MHNNVLQFDTEELFNYEELHYYDEDGQRGFLAYLIKTEEWKVIDNKIVFINVISEKEALETISMVGLIKISRYDRRRKTENWKKRKEARFIAEIILKNELM